MSWRPRAGAASLVSSRNLTAAFAFSPFFFPFSLSVVLPGLAEEAEEEEEDDDEDGEEEASSRPAGGE